MLSQQWALQRRAHEIYVSFPSSDLPFTHTRHVQTREAEAKESGIKGL